MANAIPSRLGQVNGAGDALALYLKVFSGEVLTAFNRNAYYRDKHTVRTIAFGKSAQFPAIGITSAYTHTPGDEILGQLIKANERVINIEGMKISPVFVPNIDEAMNHYDYRSAYSTDIGQALSKLYDQDVARTIMMAARTATPLVNGVYSGDSLTSSVTVSNSGTDGPTLFNAIYDGLVVLDNRDVPSDGRFITVRPTQYALLIKSEKPFDYRLNDGQTGLGGYAQGAVRMIGGSPVGKTNNYVNTDDRTATTQPSGRQHDFSTSQATIHHPRAAGTVQLQDVTMEAEYDMRRQGWLHLGKFICGHDYLDPAAAYEILSANAAG